VAASRKVREKEYDKRATIKSKKAAKGPRHLPKFLSFLRKRTVKVKKKANNKSVYQRRSGGGPSGKNVKKPRKGSESRVLKKGEKNSLCRSGPSPSKEGKGSSRCSPRGRIRKKINSFINFTEKVVIKRKGPRENMTFRSFRLISLSASHWKPKS